MMPVGLKTPDKSVAVGMLTPVNVVVTNPIPGPLTINVALSASNINVTLSTPSVHSTAFKSDPSQSHSEPLKRPATSDAGFCKKPRLNPGEKVPSPDDDLTEPESDDDWRYYLNYLVVKERATYFKENSRPQTTPKSKRQPRLRSKSTKSSA